MTMMITRMSLAVLYQHGNDDGYSVASEEVLQHSTDNDNNNETRMKPVLAAISSTLKNKKTKKNVSPQSHRPPLLFHTRTREFSLSDKVIRSCLSL